MNLYAVFSYNLSIYRFGSLYQTLTSKSQSNKGSFTLPTYGVGYATTSSSTTVSYNNGATISTASTSLYIIYQYSISLYKYDTLYQTLTANSQSSTARFTLPTCTPDDDETFYGWTKTSGNTEKDYDAEQTVTSSGMTLYAIFSYVEVTNVTSQILSTGSLVSATVPIAGTVIIKGYYSKTLGSTTCGEITIPALSSGNNYYAMVGGKYVSGTVSGSLQHNQYGAAYHSFTKTISQTVSANTDIEVRGQTTNSSAGYIQHVVAIEYPTGETTSTTKYRSTK
jgi:hypothetical protein